MTTSVRWIAAFAMLAAANFAHAELPQRAPLQILEPRSTDAIDDPEIAPSPPWMGVDMAMQGNVALVGMSGAFDATGRVAAFVRDATGKWIRRQTLTASDPAVGAFFGEHIAIFNGRALITSSRAVYIFQLTSSKWRQVGKLAFGRAVQVRDLDWHWNTVVVGASDSTGNAAYVFHLNADGTFTRIARLAPSDAVAADLFGEQVAVFSSTVAVTAPGYNSEQGAAYIFTCSEARCAQRQKLLANDGQRGDDFGSAVDLASGVLVIGAPSADWEECDMAEPPSERNHCAAGSAYLFVRSGSTWTEQQKLHPSAQELNWYATFGYAVAVSATHVVIGAPYQFEGAPGNVIDYRWSGGALVANKVMVNEGSHGHALALYNDALFVGAPNNPGFWGFAAVYNLAR